MLITDDLLTHDLLTCVGVSIEHADGSTECTEGAACVLPHHLHPFASACVEFSPPCPCVPEDGLSDAWLLAA